MFLFQLGLLTELVEQQFNNPRMGEVRLSSRLKAGAYWSALYGAYGNWTAATLAVIFGAASLSPIIGAGQGAQSWHELVVTLDFSTVGIAIVVSSILELWRLRRATVLC